MNLPNYINFAPFNELRQKMHAVELGNFDLQAFRERRKAAAEAAVEAAKQAKPDKAAASKPKRKRRKSSKAAA